MLKLAKNGQKASIFGHLFAIFGRNFDKKWNMRKNAQIGVIHTTTRHAFPYLPWPEALKPLEAIKITKTKNGPKMVQNQGFSGHFRSKNCQFRPQNHKKRPKNRFLLLKSPKITQKHPESITWTRRRIFGQI